jgi:ABC-type glycerol-3-phosphate transport system substrate-binding protein
VRGGGASASKAEDFLLWLLRPENQKKLSYETGLMSMNLNASVLDPNEVASRDAAIIASDVVAVDPSRTETGPSAAWTGLLGRTLASPAEWERALSEAEAAKRKE